MLANREGLFHAYPAEIGLDEQGNSKLACYTILFRIFEEKQNGEWIDVAGENMEITGWFYLETKANRSGHWIDYKGKPHLVEQSDPVVLEGMD